MRVGLLAIAAAALVGCGFTADFDGTRYRCDAEHACPAGGTCAASGYCEAESDGGSPGPDAGASGPCGTSDALRESFDDAARVDRLWSDDSNGGTAGADGGRLVLSLPAGDTAVVAGRTATRWYRFDRSGLSVRVAKPPAGTARLRLYLRFSGGLEMDMAARPGTVEVIRRSAAGEDTLGAADWDATAQPQLRVRDDGSALLFEVGAADAWTQVASASRMPDELAAASIYLSDDAARIDPVSAEIDDINQGATGVLCRASSLTDDFEDGSAGPAWEPWIYRECHLAEEYGQLRFHNMATEYNDCGYRSRAGLDMRGDVIEVEVPPPDPDAGALDFGLKVADDRYYVMVLRPGATTLEAQVPGGGTVGSASFVAADARFWRLEHDEALGELRFLYSSDRTTWVLLGATEGTDLDNVQIALYASEHADGTGHVAFDGLNPLDR